MSIKLENELLELQKDRLDFADSSDLSDAEKEQILTNIDIDIEKIKDKISKSQKNVAKKTVKAPAKVADKATEKVDENHLRYSKEKIEAHKEKMDKVAKDKNAVMYEKLREELKEMQSENRITKRMYLESQEETPQTEKPAPVAVAPKEEKPTEKPKETPTEVPEKPAKATKQQDFTQVLKIVDSSPDVAAFGKADTYNQNNSINLGMAAKLLNQNNLSIKSVNQEAIIERFKLKGFEYGNWATQTERFNFLIACKISFEQLRDLGFENLGLDGKIIVSFGARGQGGAAAHFEPKTFAINLTKKRGFGVFTHEYGHALDYFFGTYIDQDATSLALSYGRKTGVIALDGFEKTSMRYLMNDLINDIIQNTELIKRLDANVGRDNDYWYRRNEIFARMFEQGIHTVLRVDTRNDFLTTNKYEDFCYLTKNEYAAIVPKMRKLIDKIKPYLKVK